MQDFAQYGESGLLGVILMYMAWQMRQSGGHSQGIKKELDELRNWRGRMITMQLDLHDWHKPDANGEQSWKNARLIDAVTGNTKMLAKVEGVLDRLVPVLERLERAPVTREG